jgi:hypothetical protein
VQGFVDRLTSTPATDGHHELPRSWACDFGAPRSICTHRLPDATVDLSVVFEPPGRLAAGRATGRVVAAGSDKPTPGATERLTISGEDVGGGTRFLVVGKQPCGRSAAATEAAMEEAGSPPFADDRLPWHGFSSNYLLPFDVYLRPARGGAYHACLFWQEHDTDAEALAVVQTTFTWFAPAKAHA